MKKVLFIAFLAVAAMASAQQHKVLTVTPSEADSNKNAETDYQVLGVKFADAFALTIQTKYTQLGGTSDGKTTIEASGDGTNYFPLTSTNCTACQFSNVTSGGTVTSNDTMTIANGSIWRVVVPVTYDYTYRLKHVGTSNDSTLIITKYIYK